MIVAHGGVHPPQTLLDKITPLVVQNLREPRRNAAEPTRIPAMKFTTNWKVFLSPLGAAFSALCFFLPWVKVTCTGVRRTLTGAQLGGVPWLAFAAALIIIAAFFVCKKQRKLHWARPVILLGSAMGLVALILKYFEDSPRILGILHPSKLGLAIQFGLVGTPVGLLIALLGVVFLKPMRAPDREVKTVALPRLTACPSRPPLTEESARARARERTPDA